MVKVGGGLSRPIVVSRGIRQGCPLSGQLYSIAIEPLLFNIRKTLNGLSIPTMPQHLRTIITAYADDVTVFVNDNNDIKALSKVIDIYEGASSAKVNWDKTEAFWSGQRILENLPYLPGNLKWNRTGIKILGVFLGSAEFQKKNWEGILERVCTRLSRWNWLLPQLSYRGRVLVVNNLVASARVRTVMKNLESHGILKPHFPGLESFGKMNKPRKFWKSHGNLFYKSLYNTIMFIRVLNFGTGLRMGYIAYFYSFPQLSNLK